MRRSISVIHSLRRREFLGLGVGGVAAVSLGATFWSDLFGEAQDPGLRPWLGYGPRGRPDANGVRLPEGFSSRVIARGRERVQGTDYVWHEASDGAATFPSKDGGWILASNSETDPGGASAIRFTADGRPADAYRILEGTRHNCSGGDTPWATWLSCEEVEDGRVWECDVTGRRQPVVRPAMGVFKHEAAAVHAATRTVYLTEDLEDGLFYRFTPERWPDLEAGRLEAARVARDGRVRWLGVPDPSARRVSLRDQVPAATRFERAEGIRLDGDVVYLATTADQRLHAYDLRRERIEVIYDGLASPSAPIIRPDQLGVSPGGELFVGEDLATREINLGVVDRKRRISRFLSVTGALHEYSELTGICFDPRGSRMYLSSQRARLPGEPVDTPGPGVILEITGPFRDHAA